MNINLGNRLLKILSLCLCLLLFFIWLLIWYILNPSTPTSERLRMVNIVKGMRSDCFEFHGQHGSFPLKISDIQGNSSSSNSIGLYEEIRYVGGKKLEEYSNQVLIYTKEIEPSGIRVVVFTDGRLEVIESDIFIEKYAATQGLKH